MTAPRRRWARIPAWRPRSVGWWSWLLPVAAGAVTIAGVFGQALGETPAATVTGAVGALVLIAAWTPFLVRLPLTTRPEASAVIGAMVWGAAAATGLYALPANAALLGIVGQYLPLDVAATWGAALVAPVTEEPAKLLGVVAVLLASGHRLRHPVEGAALGALAGLGFEATELIVYAANADLLTFGEAPVPTAITIVLLREVLLVGFSHMLLTAVAGMGLAWLWPASSRLSVRRQGWGILAIAFAVIGHLLWNSPLLLSVPARIAGAILLPVAALAMLAVARRHERAWQWAALEPDAAAGLIPRPYLDALPASWRQRRRHLRAVVRTYGYGAREPQVALEAGLADLADAVSALDAAEAQRIRAELGEQLGTAGPAQS